MKKMEYMKSDIQLEKSNVEILCLGKAREKLVLKKVTWILHKFLGLIE